MLPVTNSALSTEFAAKCKAATAPVAISSAVTEFSAIFAEVTELSASLQL